MKEEERLEIIEQIKQKLENIETLKSKKQQLEELSQNPIIIKYLELKQEIQSIQKNLKQSGKISKEKVIHTEFCEKLNNKNEDKIIECSHDIWIFDGSYEAYFDNVQGYTYYIRCQNEQSQNFIYNQYVCLECGKIHTSTKNEWQEFEETYTVLKDYKKPFSKQYRDLYYQLLFEHKVAEATDIIITEYKKNTTNKSRRKIIIK